MPLYKYIYFIFLQKPFTRIQQLGSNERYDCLLEANGFEKNGSLRKYSLP